MSAAPVSAAPVSAVPVTRFELPAELEASEPPERRGAARDDVRLLVARPEEIRHHRFADLPGLLRAGDLLVLNTSATLPAAVDADRSGHRFGVHVSTVLDDGRWVIEVRRPDGNGPALDVVPGELLTLPGGVRLRAVTPFPDPTAPRSRLWRADVEPGTELAPYLLRYGRPISYRYVRGRHPLSAYQTVYADSSHHAGGSAEMASAGRPFSTDLLVRLIRVGVTVAPVVLHAGVSSPELHELPAPERYEVPAATARLVGVTRAAGGRVVAVGTTVVRALESAAGDDGVVRASLGWTDLVLGPDRPARAVNGLITGWHAPEASHLTLLEAVAGSDLVGRAYAAALAHRYLWHEFGDSALLLP